MFSTVDDGIKSGDEKGWTDEDELEVHLEEYFRKKRKYAV